MRKYPQNNREKPWTSPRRSGSAKAFTLIEITLAIGIVSFGMLAILGVFGGMLTNSTDNTDRRVLVEALDALRTELNETVAFDDVYNWAGLPEGSEKELLYVTYRAKTDEEEPDPDGDRVLGVWLDPDSPTFTTTALEDARAGYWVKARVSLSPNNLIEDISTYATSDSYPKAMLLLLVELDIVETPDIDLPENPMLSGQIGVLRR